MKRALCLVPLLGACATPDLGPQITAADAALTITRDRNRAAIEQMAAQELASAEDILIAERREVLLLSQACDLAVVLPEQSTRCEIVTQADPGAGTVNATQILRAEAALAAYLAAVGRLGDARTSEGVRARVGDVIAALAGFADTVDDADLRAATARLTADGDRIGRAVGFLVDQYRHRALRRIVGAADPVIAEMTAIMVGWLDGQPGSRVDAQAELLAAAARMEVLRQTGSAAAHRAAIAEVRRRHAAYREAHDRSAATHYGLFAQTHSALAARLRGEVSPEEAIAPLEELKAILATTSN